MTSCDIAGIPTQLPMSDQEETFIAWVRKHPDIYAAFVQMAKNAKQSGMSRVGAKALGEALRLQGARIPNTHVSYLARLASSIEPELQGFFTTARKR